jgi:hypothetical protein
MKGLTMLKIQPDNKQPLTTWVLRWRYGFTCLLLCLALIACSSDSATTRGSAFSELEALADSNGDFEVELSVTTSPGESRISLNNNFEEVKVTVFSAETPRGRTLQGIALAGPTTSNLSLNFTKISFRGNLTQLQGHRVALGFLKYDGLDGEATAESSYLPSFLYLAADDWEAPTALTTTLTDSVRYRLIEGADGPAITARGSEAGIVLAYTSSPASNALAPSMISTGSGLLRFSGAQQAGVDLPLAAGEGQLQEGESSLNIIAILIGWKVEEGEG